MLDLIEQHRSTIVFANSRRLAERLTARLNELAAERAEAAEEPATSPSRPRQPAESRTARRRLMAQAGAAGRGAPPVIARAHHGSVSPGAARHIEEELKAGRLPAVVATSSLELGIDMGAVDLVVQVESPPSVASGLQRVGRAGHQVGAVSRGVVFPKYRGDLVQCAVVAERMRAGADRGAAGTRATRSTCWPSRSWRWSRWTTGRSTSSSAGPPGRALRRAARAGPRGGARHAGRPLPERRVRRAAAADGLGPGRRALRAGPARSDWRSPAAAPSPTAGLFGVFLARAPSEQPRRVGELDEEMVYESRVGDVFVLGRQLLADRGHHPRPGAGHARTRAAGQDAVLEGRRARPARRAGPGHGRVLPRAVRGRPSRRRRPKLRAGRAGRAGGRQPVGYLAEQRAATGHVPDDRTLVVERFRDELGDWRVVLHSPVRRPGARAVGAGRRRPAARALRRLDVQAMHADDGIVLRLPDTDEPPPAGDRAVRARRDRAPGHRRGRRLGAVRLPVPRVRRPGAAAAPPRARAGARRCGSSGSGPPSCSRWPRVRRLPDRARDGARVPAGRLRPARRWSG